MKKLSILLGVLLIFGCSNADNDDNLPIDNPDATVLEDTYTGPNSDAGNCKECETCKEGDECPACNCKECETCKECPECNTDALNSQLTSCNNELATTKQALKTEQNANESCVGDLDTCNKDLSELSAKPRSVILAMHYGYLRNWGLQIVFWLTGGGFFIWWLIDLFRLAGLVKNYNKDVATDTMRNLKAMSS